MTAPEAAAQTCRHCGRHIIEEDGRWVDPEATGDDITWRETCDAHDTFIADHEPVVPEPDGPLAETIAAFLSEDRDAQAWAEFPELQGVHEEPDCDVMSNRFLAFAGKRGLQGRLIHVRPPEHDPWYSDHYFAVFDDVAVDWTARQFHNVAQNPEEWLDPASIPVPLTFTWPGEYPISAVEWKEVENDGT